MRNFFSCSHRIIYTRSTHLQGITEDVRSIFLSLSSLNSTFFAFLNLFCVRQALKYGMEVGKLRCPYLRQFCSDQLQIFINHASLKNACEIWILKLDGSEESTSLHCTIRAFLISQVHFFFISKKIIKNISYGRRV